VLKFYGTVADRRLEVLGMIQVRHEQINQSVILRIIDMPELDAELRRTLDQHIVQVCEGNSGADAVSVKQRIRDFLATKTFETQIGAIAEFIIHVYLNWTGMKQECLFFNLEEGSIKKGFDGVYTQELKTWILESKSGSIATSGICHSAKVREAYNDLEGKIAGRQSNNPWRNAYNHASHIDVAASRTLRDLVRELADSFDQKTFSSIAEFNVIPSSTIFLNGDWADLVDERVVSRVTDFAESLPDHSVVFLCATLVSVDSFFEYLG
jgi:hypothetical protein